MFTTLKLTTYLKKQIIIFGQNVKTEMTSIKIVNKKKN